MQAVIIKECKVSAFSEEFKTCVETNGNKEGRGGQNGRVKENTLKT